MKSRGCPGPTPGDEVSSFNLDNGEDNSSGLSVSDEEPSSNDDSEDEEHKTPTRYRGIDGGTYNIKKPTLEFSDKKYKDEKAERGKDGDIAAGAHRIIEGKIPTAEERAAYRKEQVEKAKFEIEYNIMLYTGLTRRWVNPTLGKIRGQDGYGCGAFKTCSRSYGGHQGGDYESIAGQDVYAVTDGTITNIAPFTSNDLSLMYVKILTDSGDEVRIAYIGSLSVRKGDSVLAGEIIGKAMSLQYAYPPRRQGKMTDHVHVDIKDRFGKTINPNDRIKN